MNEKITQLKTQIEEGNFQEIFDYLDLYFKPNPYYQYSNLKQEILYQMKAGFPPRPMQVQAFKIFLNDDKVKQAILFIKKNNSNITPKTTQNMAYGIDKEIEGLKEVIKLLVEKVSMFGKAIQTTIDAEHKLLYRIKLQETEKELEKYRKKIQKLKDENSSNSDLKDLDNKTQKVQEEIKENLEEKKNTESKTSKKPPIKIFLASSAELKEDRRELREFFSLENDRMYEREIYFKLIQWEYFLDTISNTRLQDEYNKALQDCDLVIGLFFTKAGKYTEEELEKAYHYFKETGKPNILTYFKDAPINTNDITDEILSLLKMKKNLTDKGHFYTSYKNISELKNHLKSQLEKLGYL